MPVAPPPNLILDTNVVLDWLFFADPQAGAIATAVESRRLRWVATRAMRDEFVDVLGREALRSRRPDAVRKLPLQFDALAVLWPNDDAGTAAAAPRCRDAADQKFIDLALACGAQWLLTRDRALLDLRGPAGKLGVQILAPRDWSAATGGDPARRG